MTHPAADYARSLEDEAERAERSAYDLAAIVRDLRDGGFPEMADDLAIVVRQLRIHVLDLRGRMAAVWKM